MKPQYAIYDVDVLVWFDEATPPPPWHQPFGLQPFQWEQFNRLCDALTEGGFTIGPDPKLNGRRGKYLRKHHRYGRHGDLELGAEAFPRIMEFRFFQNVVFQNPNGGRYDFDKREKMPYLVRKRWEGAVRRLCPLLESWGYERRPDKTSPLVDPLAWFNEGWKSHRLERGPDGWPTEKALPWAGLDGDGVKLQVGDHRYFRDQTGRLWRGRVYPNLNDMWLVVYGASYSVVSARELFSCDPRQTARRIHPAPKRRLEQLLDQAAKAQEFERAIRYRDALRRLSGGSSERRGA